MNRETRNRIKEAKQYEMLALKALFPKEAQGHIEVIEQEIKAMLMECVLDFVTQDSKESGTKESEEQVKKVKKVTIG